jgi:hypothetical protein
MTLSPFTAFYQEMTCKAKTAGSERATDSELPPSRPAAHEQQVRQIRAGDEQESGHRGEQDDDGALEPRIDAVNGARHACANGFRPTVIESLGHERLHFAPRGIRCGTASQARETVV